jgi:hypothetical protein
MDKYQYISLLIALGCFGLTSLVWYVGLRLGELYLIGVPVRRRDEPFQFWATMVFFGSIPVGIGIVLIYGILRG